MCVLATLSAGCGAQSVDPAPGPCTGHTPATFEVRQSVEQLQITHATQGEELVVFDASAKELARGTADDQGSLVFRKLPPGSGYSVQSTTAPAECAGPLTVHSIENSKPSTDFYSKQKLAAGFGYIRVRDGTELSIYITLPGPIDQGPYPTVVNYSGYTPSKPGQPIAGFESMCGTIPSLCDSPDDPSAKLAAILGYATVGVNMRGTGCSGGAYDFFEPLQLLDGYDIIETVAAQDWVLNHKVGMTGISYPGISQLFVAKTHPPSLAAITPLSVIGNTMTTMVPGGIFNKGFALEWATMVLDSASPYGQNWEQARVDLGDTICEENQLLHSQKVDIVAEAKDNPYYTDDVAGAVNPTTFVNQIEVPVFLACAWQDEQTGPFFFTLLDKFSSAPSTRFTVYNGVHADAFQPATLVEWKAFLDLYVAHTKPYIDPTIRLIAPVLFQQVFGSSIDMPPDRWANVATYDQALAEWQSEPALRALYESGAGDPNALGAPVNTFELNFDRWTPPPTTTLRLYFEPDGSLGNAMPTVQNVASQFELDPGAGDRGILADGAPSDAVWYASPPYVWTQPAPGKAVIYESAALTEDLVMFGSASVDVWLRSTVNDADLEANLTEVRPDGKEMYVQSGWLRASQRKVASDSTELFVDLTQRQADEQLLVVGEWTQARIPVAGFSHVFRKGSKIRVSVDTPGDSRARWRFLLKTFDTPAVYAIGQDAVHASSIALPVLNGVAATTPLPPCTLRGQQCRDYVPYTNTPAG